VDTECSYGVINDTARVFKINPAPCRSRTHTCQPGYLNGTAVAVVRYPCVSLLLLMSLFQLGYFNTPGFDDTYPYLFSGDDADDTYADLFSGDDADDTYRDRFSGGDADDTYRDRFSGGDDDDIPNFLIETNKLPTPSPSGRPQSDILSVKDRKARRKLEKSYMFQLNQKSLQTMKMRQLQQNEREKGEQQQKSHQKMKATPLQQLRESWGQTQPRPPADEGSLDTCGDEMFLDESLPKDMGASNVKDRKARQKLENSYMFQLKQKSLQTMKLRVIQQREREKEEQQPKSRQKLRMEREKVEQQPKSRQEGGLDTCVDEWFSDFLH
jgi:hypothetical protein